MSLRELHAGTAGFGVALAAALLLAAGCASQKQGSSGGEGAGAGAAGGAGAGAGAGAGVGGGADASAGAGAGAGAAMPGAPAAGAGVSAGASAGGGSGSGGGSAESGPAQTPDERRAAIDKRFDDTLGTFDSEIRKEQEAVAKERDVRAATAATGSADTENGEDAGGESGSANGDKPVPGAEGQPEADKRSRAGDLKSDKDREKDKDKDGGGGNSTGSGASGSAIPDGSDDDIVARRLRKAAEAETDPELKEKLWKEYVEYKKNAGK